jgi:signal transduction histidine kinase
MSVIETTSDVLGPAGASSPMDANDFADLVRSFNDVTARLESTHSSLRDEVATLKTELNETHRRLRRSRQLAALGEMAAGIAHEIRNPLGAIALNLEALTEDLFDRPGELELCGRVSRSVTRLDAIVGDVLSFARDTKVRAASVRPSEVVVAAVAHAEDLVDAHDIDVDLSLDEELEIMADAALLEQSLLNLVRNACEAMALVDGPRRLTVSLCRRELRDPEQGIVPHVVFEIRDTGPGIPEEVRERMFNPFFTTRAEGTGLGLAIVHRIVDAHGGRLDVSAGDPGTIMCLSLPLDPRQEILGGADDDDDGRSLDGAVRRRVRDNSGRGAA